MAEPSSTEKADRIVWGRALKALRERNGFTLHEASARVRRFGQAAADPPAGISVQRWQQAEKGASRFTDEQIGRYAAALDASPADLEVERARILGRQPKPAPAPGVGEREPRSWAIPIYGRVELAEDGWTIRHAEHSDGSFDLRELATTAIGMVRMPDATMTGWAEPGTQIIFDRSQRPIEGKGCVVETKAGELYPRLFVGIDDEHVIVRSMASPMPQAFARKSIKGVYAVRFRGD